MIRKVKAFCFILCIFSVFQSRSLSAEEMSVAYPEFYPFFAETADGEVKGFFHDIIVEAVDHRMGIKTRWTQFPWKRCQRLVKAGKFDAMITVPTKERLEYSVTHKDPFYRKEMTLFTYRNHPRLNEILKIRTLADIKKGGFVMLTYSGNGWHKDKVDALGIPSFKTSEVYNVWKMLAARRGDLVIEWAIGARAGIKKSRTFHKILETGISLESMPFHLLISKQSPFRRILPRFNDIVRKMTQDGTINRIVSGY